VVLAAFSTEPKRVNEYGTPALDSEASKAVDTKSSAGRMVMQMLGSFAEFERSGP
jgi:DNA invertase Pin-like site-specific DNA recombinase